MSIMHTAHITAAIIFVGLNISAAPLMLILTNAAVTSSDIPEGIKVLAVGCCIVAGMIFIGRDPVINTLLGKPMKEAFADAYNHEVEP